MASRISTVRRAAGCWAIAFLTAMLMCRTGVGDTTGTGGGACQRGKESHLFRATRARSGVVGNEHLTLGTADGELLAAEREVADLGVTDQGRPTLEGLN